MKMKEDMKRVEGSARLGLISAMFIFGTIGIFVRYIPLPSSVLALVRGVVGTLFLLLFLKIKKQPLDKGAIKDNLWVLCLSGAFIGVNWILLFEAYRYTTVATATLCYYLAPVFVIVAAPIVLKEKNSLKKWICALIALVGMVFVSGVAEGGIPTLGELRGVMLGVGAAVFYASVMLLNKKLKPIGAYDKTILQLAAAAVVILPYALFTENVTALDWNPLSVCMLAVVGIVHTGIAYALYFGSMTHLKAHTIAIFSYVDPVVAIILSALILRESLTPLGIVGAILILGSTLVSELGE